MDEDHLLQHYLNCRDLAATQLEKWVCLIDPETKHLREDATIFTQMVTGLAILNYPSWILTAPVSNFYLDQMAREYLLFDVHPSIEEQQQGERRSKKKMSNNHKLLIPMDLSDIDFVINAALFPIGDQHVIRKLKDMKKIALYFMADQFDLDEDQIGLYFHCHPDNSIDHLHLHIVDLTQQTEYFNKIQEEGKNIPLDTIIQFLEM